LVGFLALAFKSFKSSKKRRGKTSGEQVQYVYYEEPVYVKSGDKTYECKSLQSTPQGLVCIQYDNTAVIIPPAQPQPTPPLQYKASAGVTLV
jgi:phage terminase large subunit-like protein